MTLIAAVKCVEGMVICSDMEENTAYGGKRAVNKLFDCMGQSWGMFIGAAGYSPLCDVAIRKIIKAAKEADGFLCTHQEMIGQILKEIVEKYISFDLPSQERQKREINLVIGVNDINSQETYLYKSWDEILQPMDRYACAGAGEEVAYYYLERLFEPELTLSQAKYLLAFIMKEAKASVGNVGRETQMIDVRKDGTMGRLFIGARIESELPHLYHCIRQFWKESSMPS